MFICSNCGTLNQDTGGDPAWYKCGRCGQPTLHRQVVQDTSPISNNNNALTGAVVGGTLGGVAGGPVGAIFGIVVGAVVGNQVKERPSRRVL
jgi:outer membrane lipoprotein SlyB